MDDNGIISQLDLSDLTPSQSLPSLREGEKRFKDFQSLAPKCCPGHRPNVVRSDHAINLFRRLGPINSRVVLGNDFRERRLRMILGYWLYLATNIFWQNLN